MQVPIVFVPCHAFREYAHVGLHVNFGSADELVNQHGHAHLLEHLAVRTYHPESLALSAATGRDRTSFTITVRVDQIGYSIDRFLGMVGRKLTDNAKVLAEEKDVVSREIVERAASSSWRIREASLAAVWQRTSYAHDSLGSHWNLRQARCEVLTHLYDQHYTPRNAVIVVSGDPKLASRLGSTCSTHALPPRSVLPQIPMEPTRFDVRCGQERLGHVTAWRDLGAQPQTRLLNRLGRASFHHLALRGARLTWIWVPPGTDPEVVPRVQVQRALSLLTGPSSSELTAYECSEIKRSEQVEFLASGAVERIWAGEPLVPVPSLAIRLEAWLSNLREVTQSDDDR